MRLDLLLSEKLGISRTRAQNLIKTGGVSLDGVVADKSSLEVDPSADPEIIDTLKYASLGGLKLENALKTFRIDPKDKICLDVGASNGGFTDCLLTFGAKEVHAVDLNVAFNESLQNDPRVRIYDHVNAKDLMKVFSKECFDLITVDLSFISLGVVLEELYALLKHGGALIALFKPQFEVGKGALPKSGVVRDDRAIEKSLSRILSKASALGFCFEGECLVPKIFPDKNKERTLFLSKA